MRTATLLAIVWAILTIAALAFVGRYAFTSPYADELRWTEIIAGQQSMTSQWLFQIENQHCAPVFKLAYLAIGRACGFDFRLIALANVVLLALLALGLMLAAARARGRASPLDLIFPVLLLHWDHYENLLWGFQLFYVLPTVLAGAMLLLIFSRGRRLSFPAALAAGICLLGLGFSGGPGLFYVPALSLWLGYASVKRWRGGERKDRGAAVITGLLALLSLAPLPVYLLHRTAALQFPQPAAGSSGPVLGAFQFFSVGFGRLSRSVWPLSGLLVLIGLIVAAKILYSVWRKSPEERLRAVGLGLFLGACVSLAIGIGLGRGNLEPKACMAHRYILLGSPLVLCFYLIGSRYGVPISRPQLRQGIIFGLIALAGLYSFQGWSDALRFRVRVERLEDLAAAGLPPRALAARCHLDFQDPQDSFAQHLEMLQQAGLGPYRPRIRAESSRDVTVLPMLPLETPGRESTTARIAPGEALRQPFIAPCNLPLYRIDIAAPSSPRKRTGAPPFRWKLEEIDAAGSRQTCAEGEASLHEGPDPEFVVLEFPAVHVLHGARLELTLGVDPGENPKKPLTLPLSDYIAAGEHRAGLHAYLFFGDSARTSIVSVNKKLER